MPDGRTLFLQFRATFWTQEQLDDLMEMLAEETPDDVEVVALPDDIEFLDGEQVEQIAEHLCNALKTNE
jgi:hypothetical protein